MTISVVARLALAYVVVRTFVQQAFGIRFAVVQHVARLFFDFDFLQYFKASGTHQLTRELTVSSTYVAVASVAEIADTT